MVREFAIGMGPKIFGYDKRRNTLYTSTIANWWICSNGRRRFGFSRISARLSFRNSLNDQDEIDQIVLNQNKQFPDMLFLEVEKSDLMKEMFIEGYDEEERLVRYKVARNAVINENGKETFIAPYDRQFGSKTVGQRSLAIFAGPLFNFILSFFIFLALGLFQGSSNV